MRETLDCGVLMVPAHASWIQGWMQRHGAALNHIRLHAVPVEEGGVAAGGGGTHHTGASVAAQFLARMAMSLRRFDACLLPVSSATLAWTRTALSCAGDGLHTPLVGVARGLKAAAVEDLLALGMRDFVRDPLCPEELRVRLDRVAGGKRVVGMGAPSATPDNAAQDRGAALHGSLAAAHDPWPAAPATPAGSLCEPARHYAAAQPGRGDGRPRLSQDAIDHALLTIQAAPRIHPDEPFRVAKSRVVDSFERDYLRTALSRHAGNVARAARASAKHRRAFWALMRKHDINAAPYRPRHDAADGRFPGDGGGADA
jgi:hypothetical protein